MRRGDYCTGDGLGLCVYWFKSGSGKHVVVDKDDAPAFRAEVLPIKQDNLPLAELPDWAREHAVSRNWTEKY